MEVKYKEKAFNVPQQNNKHAPQLVIPPYTLLKQYATNSSPYAHFIHHHCQPQILIFKPRLILGCKRQITLALPSLKVNMHSVTKVILYLNREKPD